MSTPSTSYRLFHADTNTITALTLHDGSGVALTPQSTVDGTDDPAGWKSKVITFAAVTAAVFATPTFSNINAPVPVYLTHTEMGVPFNVMDESEFTIATPGRPTPRGDVALQYVPNDTEGPAKTWTITLPLAFTPKVKQRTKDPLTGLPQYGNDFTVLWTGKYPESVEVQCDVEDITDPAGYVTVPYTNITAYAESSTGKSLIKLTGEIIPQDGFIHALRFRMRYNFSGDVSAWVEADWQKAMYALPAPNEVTNVSVNVLRDRIDAIPDRLTVTWAWAGTNPGDAVDVYAIDPFGKSHLLGEETDNTVTSMTVENVTRFYQIHRPPAIQTAYRFGVVAKNRSSKSAMAFTAAAVMLTCKIRDVAPLTPDEIAGTAEDVDYMGFITKASAAANALTTSGLTIDQKAVLAGLMGYAAEAIFDTIKSVVMKGGKVTIANFGLFKAKWSADHFGRNPSTGETVLVPAARGTAFTPSLGYKVGTVHGQILTDVAAKAL